MACARAALYNMPAPKNDIKHYPYNRKNDKRSFECNHSVICSNLFP